MSIFRNGGWRLVVAYEVGTTRQERTETMATAETPATERPAVVVWYRVYCVLMALLYLALVVIGVALVALGLMGQEAFDGDPTEAVVMGAVYGVMGFVAFIPFVIGALVPARPWAWVYGIVMICIGLTSCCCMPACIPLLIFWIKPETRRYFGRS